MQKCKLTDVAAWPGLRFEYLSMASLCLIEKAH
uniref:Uncharacterized protein n=1 Tax=Arundo donax TaxID=35708 RepID=A0A0A9F3A7_ARUDO